MRCQNCIHHKYKCFNENFYAIHSDHLNTPRRLTNAQGQVAWQWLLTGFGEVNPTIGANGYVQTDSAAAGAMPNYAPDVTFNLRYPGQQWDEETGLAFNMNRYYHPQEGRYIQADPIGLDGGWNRFVYVGGNPLNAVDPEGLNWVVVVNRVVASGQGLYYRYGPAIVQLINEMSGVNGTLVAAAPVNLLIAQIPMYASRMTPVATGIVEAIETGSFACTPKIIQTENLIYRAASGTPQSMTPHLTDINGLSASNGLKNALPGKNQIIDTTRLNNLCAVCDNLKTGHVSITPKDMNQLPEWINSRGSNEVHPFTQELINAIIGTTKK